MRFAFQLIEKYFNLLFIKQFFIIFLFFSIFIYGNQYLFVFKNVSSQSIFAGEIIELINNRFFSDISLIFALSFFLSLINTFYGLSRRSELVIYQSAGKGLIDLLKNFTNILIISVVIISLLSFFIEPSLNRNYSNLKAEIEQRPSYLNINPGKFYKFQNDNITFYTSKIDTKNQNFDLFEDIMIYIKKDKSIIIADNGSRDILSKNEIRLDLDNGVIYSNFLDKEKQLAVTRFNKYSINLGLSKNHETPEINKHNTLGTLYLFRNLDNADFSSEIYWRISKVISFIFLILISIYFSKTNNRNIKIHPSIFGVIFFLVVFYYNNYIKILIQRELVSFDLSVILGLIPILLISFVLFKNSIITKYNNG